MSNTSSSTCFQRRTRRSSSQRSNYSGLFRSSVTSSSSTSSFMKLAAITNPQQDRQQDPNSEISLFGGKACYPCSNPAEDKQILLLQDKSQVDDDKFSRRSRMDQMDAFNEFLQRDDCCYWDESSEDYHLDGSCSRSCSNQQGGQRRRSSRRSGGKKTKLSQKLCSWWK